MQNAINPANPRRIAALAMAAVAVVVVAAAVIALWQSHQSAQATLDRVAPRHARLAGLVAAQPQLALAQEQGRLALARYAYPATLDASQAGNDAQQRIRAAFALAKLELMSSQVLPAKTEPGYERIPVSVRTEGDLAALQTALMALSSTTPAILVDAVNVQGNAFARADSGRLVVQFSLSVLRVKP